MTRGRPRRVRWPELPPKFRTPEKLGAADYQTYESLRNRAIREGVAAVALGGANGKREAGQEPARRMNTKRAGAMNTGPKSRKGERL